MADAQLMTRVRKITKSEKLDCFIQMADNCNKGELLQAGFDRWHTLFSTRHYLERQAAAFRRIPDPAPTPLSSLTERERFILSKPRLKKNKPKIIYEPEFRMIR